VGITAIGISYITVNVPSPCLEMGKRQYYQHAFVAGRLRMILGKPGRLLAGLMKNFRANGGIGDAGVGNDPIVAFKYLQITASEGTPSSIVFALNQKFPV
jgi:hypothetical protein